jgi:hypothetical protein
MEKHCGSIEHKSSNHCEVTISSRRSSNAPWLNMGTTSEPFTTDVT